jgi:hypothetical protein
MQATVLTEDEARRIAVNTYPPGDGRLAGGVRM